MTLTQMSAEEVSFSWAVGRSLDMGWPSAGAEVHVYIGAGGRRERERSDNTCAALVSLTNHWLR